MEGEQIDRDPLKNVFNLFVEKGKGMGNRGSRQLIEQAAAFYAKKASIWAVECSCPDYMLKVEACLEKENRRADRNYFINRKHLLDAVQHELLSVYATQLLGHALFRDDNVDNLSRMYRLFSRIPQGSELVASVFKQYVTAQVTALVKQAEDAKAENRGVDGLQELVFVRKVAELHHKFMALVKDCFRGDDLFRKPLRQTFETVCNRCVAGSTITAELLATFCDNILKKGGGDKLSDEAIEDTLGKAVKLVAYINDKDLFREFYRKKLARRLLFGESSNNENERSILSKLKQQCGGPFTSRMEGMVTDLTLAREDQTSFEEYLSVTAGASPGIDFTVSVLTMGFWPSYKSSHLNLPAEMVKCVEVFREFYQKKTKHRKLTWIHSLGSCYVNGMFDEETIELIVSTYQAAALLLFNGSDRLSFQEIISQLNLPEEDVVRVLHSLSCAKYKILLKEPNTKTISSSDVFEFNSKFTGKTRRIKGGPIKDFQTRLIENVTKYIQKIFKISQYKTNPPLKIPMPPVHNEKRKVVVDKDRRYTVDASIVRIMKSRKVLGYQELIMECKEHLGRMFKPDVKLIKKRIEDLITREYLERDAKDQNMFRYLA